MTYRRKTLGRPFWASGIGVHTGEVAHLCAQPAPFGTGLRFASVGGEEVAVHIDHVVEADGATVLEANGLRIGTPEHLLAALVAAGITDALVVLDGREVPIRDGSARDWCSQIAIAGAVEGEPVQPLVLHEPVRVEAAGGWAEARPSEGLSLAVDVDFPDGPSGSASVAIPGAFVEEVAWARTFALERDIVRLRAAGRGRGATRHNTVIWGSEGPIDPVRGPDEPIRHKLLDLVGDLALAGRPVQAEIRVVRGSHALHHALVRALLSP